MKTSIAMLVLMLVVTTLAGAGELKEDLVTLEKDAWKAWSKGDGDFFRKNLTEDHVQVVAGAGWVVGREAIATEIAKGACEVESFDFHDIKLRHVTKDVAILSYTATQDASCEGNKMPAKVYSTSIYVKQDGKWLSANYQETPAD
jgi:uncharacterized protein (TIGR02246 family)